MAHRWAGPVLTYACLLAVVGDLACLKACVGLLVVVAGLKGWIPGKSRDKSYLAPCALGVVGLSFLVRSMIPGDAQGLYVFLGLLGLLLATVVAVAVVRIKRQSRLIKRH